MTYVITQMRLKGIQKLYTFFDKPYLQSSFEMSDYGRNGVTLQNVVIRTNLYDSNVTGRGRTFKKLLKIRYRL